MSRKIGREEQRKQRETSGIGNSAHLPAVARAPHRAREKEPRKGEPAEDKKAGVKNQFESVVKHVVTHLVRHHHADFREAALLEKIVVQRNSCGAEDAGDICAHSFALPGFIDLKDLVNWNFVCPRHGKDRLADF